MHKIQIWVDSSGIQGLAPTAKMGFGCAYQCFERCRPTNHTKIVAAYTAADKLNAIIAIDVPTARSESLSPFHKIAFGDLAEWGEM